MRTCRHIDGTDRGQWGWRLCDKPAINASPRTAHAAREERELSGHCGGTHPHLGEMKLTTVLSSGRSAKFTFQGAPVRKPLLAVSGIVGKGNSVAFSPSGCWIVPPSSRAAVDISNLASRHPEALRMTEKMGCTF